MKVILVIVTSINGKSTRGDEDNVSKWTSTEDKKIFSETIKNAKVMVMGRTTYESAKANIKLSSDKLRIILTRNPQDYESVPGQLEFTNESPKDLVKRLAKKGYPELLLLSGETLSTTFFQAGLVDELLLTLEPKLFGSGRELISAPNLTADLRLLEMTKLNDLGTLLLKYQILKT